ncbi:diacylglycerol kinase (ATP) [Methylomarinovum tepidoasis]|uniref:Diacylglycerol kinase n=1 Tax=Methylomarinovum tepidoasis TaxID=2840183 RepID=A0AAU9CC51_9GAMM|nr:diacylglycerol kinase [Methylomarinovum sp. IN45]BCX89537.1 diacylglycerol kinase (ATP) [Methylomarinovum sp. IN45]
MGQPGLKGVPRLIAAFGNSMVGMKVCWRQEEAFRQEVIVSLLALPLGLWLGETAVERALLIASVWQIAIFETLNSAVEAVVDRIGTERHPLSGYAKDIASASVLLAIFLALLVWGLIGYDRFFQG